MRTRCSGGSRIFPGGCANSQIGIFCNFSAENCTKMKEFGPGGGGFSWRPPLDPKIRWILYRNALNLQNFGCFVSSRRESLHYNALRKCWTFSWLVAVSTPVACSTTVVYLYLFSGLRVCYYCPQTEFAKVMFLQLSVCHMRGMCGFIGGHVWFYLGGMHGFIWGACMVLFGGACMVLFGGHAWFYLGGHAWFFWGGMHGFFSFFRYNEIWSMSGWYASYWNAFLFWLCLLLSCILWMSSSPPSFGKLKSVLTWCTDGWL